MGYKLEGDRPEARRPGGRLWRWSRLEVMKPELELDTGGEGAGSIGLGGKGVKEREQGF